MKMTLPSGCRYQLTFGFLKAIDWLEQKNVADIMLTLSIRESQFRRVVDINKKVKVQN